MSQHSLVHIIYASTAVAPMDDAALAALLEVARRNNERLGVTGLLLYSPGSFFQVLEGEASVVDSLFETIARDARHTGTVSIIREPIARRSFGDWSMGHAVLTQRDVVATAGISGILGQSSMLSQIDHGRARKLVQAFTEGRWRARLDAADERGTKGIRGGELFVPVRR